MRAHDPSAAAVLPCTKVVIRNSFEHNMQLHHLFFESSSGQCISVRPCFSVSDVCVSEAIVCGLCVVEKLAPHQEMPSDQSIQLQP